jgi:hypothetical protein
MARSEMAQLVADLTARLRCCEPPNEATRAEMIEREHASAELIFPENDDGFVEPEFDDGFDDDMRQWKRQHGVAS